MNITEFYPGLLRFMTKRLRNKDHAADIVHEAYSRFIEMANDDVRANPKKSKQFLYTTAVNASIDDLRKTNIRRAGRDEEFDLANACEDRELYHLQPPHDCVYQIEKVALLQKVLDELPARTRQVFLMRKLDGMTHVEISSQLGISTDMVAKHIINAMKFCRVRVQELEYSRADSGFYDQVKPRKKATLQS
ncbi:sigma-70 family RNA polymerase sigma factor [Pseudomonas aeruginosa]|uniref:sigma-70 family RNA polymerase sigma factor n=1 Tax=Pseudomonas aeruginosa TaxID=287 RepID=UPI0013DF69A3|nr:sigma-70 family RNA polymerase sigma factor [Pseudomonas aeruginosa]